MNASQLAARFFTQAREHLEQARKLYIPQQHHTLVFLHGEDLGVTSLGFMSWALWQLGYPDEALQRGREALTLAEELAHPFSLAFALGMAVDLHRLRGEQRETKAYAEAEMSLCREHRFAIHEAIGTLYQNWVFAEQEPDYKGLALILQGLTNVRETGIAWRYGDLLVAEAYGKTGQVEEGLAVLAGTLESVNNDGEHFYEAELYRLKGELTLQHNREQGTGNGGQQKETDPRSLMPDAQGEAQACFLKAIAIAQKQQAKSWELRAATSLARLWQAQGKTTEARDLLAPVYEWFTEGFDTKDLQEAQALLQELKGA
ncbi:MAG: hypothetical protein AB7G75_12055 [Candidatus Binatia bacterium]